MSVLRVQYLYIVTILCTWKHSFGGHRQGRLKYPIYPENADIEKLYHVIKPMTLLISINSFIIKIFPLLECIHE